MLRRQSHTRLTLALDIVRRIDEGPRVGYHELAVVKHQIDLHDTIALEDADESSVECAAPGVPTDGSNICLRAVSLVKERFQIRRGVRVRIDKRIPVMGGLAGGSANAATMLTMLNDLWELGQTGTQLAALGRELGMDVPFCLTGGTALDSETGGEASGIPTNLTFDFVLAVPSFGVSTKAAYEGLDCSRTGRQRERTARMVSALAADDRGRVVECIHNDFEPTVFHRHPELPRIRDALLGVGAEAAFMSGSGSTIVGIARDASHAREVAEAVSGAGLPLTSATCCRSLGPRK